jgi:hypothetical protein
MMSVTMGLGEVALRYLALNPGVVMNRLEKMFGGGIQSDVECY